MSCNVMVSIRLEIIYEHRVDSHIKNIKVIFGNSFYFLFSKFYFWEYKKKNFLYF